VSQIVVDSSLAVKWELPEDDSATAQALLEQWVTDNIVRVVPSWFACEIANVFFQRLKGGEITQAAAERSYYRIIRAVSPFGFDPAVGARALVIAQQTRQRASYDAHYVALAEQLGCDLWTADERFWRAVHDDFPFVKWLGNVQART